MVRRILAITAAGLLVAGTASAAPARVSGAGFYRDGKGKNATKTMLTVQGDAGSGRAEQTVHGPGKAKTSLRLTLSCVVVNGSTAYASGRDAAGNEWFLKVVDNGSPGRNDAYGLSRTAETFMGVPVPAALSSTCRAGQVATRAISGGGNFQVAPAS